MNNGKRVEDNEYFVSMIQLAMDEDEDIAGVIRAIVKMEPDERIRVIEGIVERFRKNQVAGEIIDAMEYLKDEEVSAKIRSLL